MSKKKLVATSLDDAQFQQLESLASKNGLSMSSVIRNAVIRYLEKFTNNDNASVIIETKNAQ
jgi:metal-responsive CopG/Arc/MetJ family transcriptional regulator